MADLPQQNTIVQYLADGIEDTYIVPFYTPIETDGTPNIDVFTQLATGPAIPADDINEWNVDYTYTANLDPITGGVIVFEPGSIPPSGYAVTIARDVQASLDVDFSQAQTFSGITLDAALDKLLLITQQNKTFALQRNISYIINTYLPEDEITANIQIPVLGAGEVWFGSAGGVIAAELEQPADVSTLRSELANEQPTTNGAALVGFYDETNLNPTTVAYQLNYLTDYVLGSTPTGVVLDFAGTVVPTGFLPCDGAAVSRVTYSDLFGVIGTIWGIGDGSSTFNVPDFSRRVAVGSGGASTGILGNAVGDLGGDEEETLTDPLQLPAHNHVATNTVTDVARETLVAGSSPQNAFTVGNSAGAQQNTPMSITVTTVIEDTGASDPFSIIQPSAVVLKIIKI